jgi:hypothetical protein
VTSVNRTARASCCTRRAEAKRRGCFRMRRLRGAAQSRNETPSHRATRRGRCVLVHPRRTRVRGRELLVHAVVLFDKGAEGMRNESQFDVAFVRCHGGAVRERPRAPTRVLVSAPGAFAVKRWPCGPGRQAQAFARLRRSAATGGTGASRRGVAAGVAARSSGSSGSRWSPSFPPLAARAGRRTGCSLAPVPRPPPPGVPWIRVRAS